MSEENEISGLWDLPECCTSYIISFTSPKDACIASAVSMGFKSAAESDTVWEGFLPPDYQDIIARSVSPVLYSSKKELYFHLCDSPLLLDDGKLSFRLSKPSGKKCYMLCARELNIIWGDTPMYWNWRTLTESRFAEHISCSKSFRNSYGLESRSKASVKLVQQSISDVEGGNNTVYLERPTHVQDIDGRMPEERRDMWMEIELGEYFNDEGDEGDIQMQLLETEILGWKRGLIIEGIELRPKEG
ncbi:F-box protein PP2-B10 [Abeliophyllum distichum]|uniref:F-box protein PP2-B10 n=1 Tax=Abeliophyllum distichum TaxID=126358 RepID=A0ABD1RAK6_9LAMI